MRSHSQILGPPSLWTNRRIFSAQSSLYYNFLLLWLSHSQACEVFMAAETSQQHFFFFNNNFEFNKLVIHLENSGLEVIVFRFVFVGDSWCLSDNCITLHNKTITHRCILLVSKAIFSIGWKSLFSFYPQTFCNQSLIWPR